MYSLIQHSKSIESIMKAWFDNSKSVLSHSGNLGFVREHFVKEILNNFLPKDVIIGSGEIIDLNKKISNQQDIIIYRANFPVISSFSNINTYLAEGVIATIEIKSDFSKGKPELLTAFQNTKSIHDLQKAGHFHGSNETEIHNIKFFTSIKTYVIGYNGWVNSEKFIEKVKSSSEKSESTIPHLVYQPGMCLFRNDGFIEKSPTSSASSYLFTEENCFAVFMHHLLKAVMINTGGLELSILGYETKLKYNLDSYFNFSPPLKCKILHF